ncbi:MAG: aminopeptidase P family protein [Angelakisella sp.]
MNITTQRLAALRASMAKSGVDGYLVPSADPHMSEYLPDCYRSRSWLSGFTGSAGTLAVTANQAALWTDGRYYIQAEHQLADSGIALMRGKEKTTPKLHSWLAEQLPEGGVMGIDGMITTIATVEELERAFADKKQTIRDANLLLPLWTDRPAAPATEIWQLTDAVAGKSVAEKLTAVRAKLGEQQAEGTLLTALDSVAWLLNIRADDVAYTPFAMAFCLVLPDSAVLFVNRERLPQAIEASLNANGVTVMAYEAVAGVLSTLDTPVKLVYSANGLSYTLFSAMKGNKHITLSVSKEPVQQLKGTKNEAELAGLKAAHRKDGVAMVRTQIEFEQRLAAGEALTEMDVCDIVEKNRRAQPGSLGLSFNSIVAYGANAAMMHYSPTAASHATLERKGLLLIDSGGQYLDGTTDITRTYALGELTEQQKEYYTLVLRSHIGLAKAVFMEGCTGGSLDILARGPVWQHGIDYRCGTGHGVGFVGAIHEGPQDMRIGSNVPFQVGMTITDEPGIYEEGNVGIRIENELLCKEWGENEYGRFFCFEAFTYCPIDTRPVLVSLLTEDELEWLNSYHAMVYDAIADLLTAEEQRWLKNATRPLRKG